MVTLHLTVMDAFTFDWRADWPDSQQVISGKFGCVGTYGPTHTCFLVISLMG